MEYEDESPCDTCETTFDARVERCIVCSHNPRCKNNYQKREDIFRKELTEAFAERDKINEQIREAFIERGKKAEVFCNAGNTLKMDIETYRTLMGNAERILKEINSQLHMHGETEETPDLLIAKECYFLGYFNGKHEGFMDTITRLDLLKDYKKLEQEQARLKDGRFMRKVVNKYDHSRLPDLFAMFDNPVAEEGLERIKDGD